MRTLLRKLLFSDLMKTLSVLLGVMQALVLCWALVVLAGRDAPSAGAAALLAVSLAAANLAVTPVLRRSRHKLGWPRTLAATHMTVAIFTLLVGLAVVVSWVGLTPFHVGLDLLGADDRSTDAFFRGASIAVVASAAGMVAWGFTGGQAGVERTQLRFEIAGLDPRRAGLRIVQISDLHIGNGMEGERLERLVADVNGMRPDLIALTGDLFDFDPSFIADGARGLSKLDAPLGVFAVLGNHDVYAGRELVVSSLAEHAPGIQVLRGDRVRLPGEGTLYIAGVDDPGRSLNWTDRDLHLEDLEDLGAEMPADGPVVLLVHRPEAFPQAARLGFPLVLAGHTHGGQLALPATRGRLNLARIITRFHRGVYRERESVLYVNRGIGIAGPAIRLACSREIATIELASTA